MSSERDRFDEIGKIKREIDASSQMVRRHMLAPAGIPLNTITPCAACKLLRRRCAEECPFAPYFSPLEPQKFAAVHKVFGASNVSKMLLEVPESQRADAANSLVYEANVRLRDPVYGCMGAISALQQQVQSLHAELNAVRAEILKYKYREAANSIIALTHVDLISSVAKSILPPVPTPNTHQITPPSPPLAPPPSIASTSVVVSAGLSPLYIHSSSQAGYNTIPTKNMPYFD